MFGVAAATRGRAGRSCRRCQTTPGWRSAALALALCGTLAASGAWAAEPVAPPDAADLEAGVDTPLDAAIVVLAESLDRNPVRIFNWVHDNVEFVPGHGVVQGAVGTLAARRGNAFDQSSLLIALLRASGVAARHQVGTAEVPLPTLENLLGGLRGADAVVDVLERSGMRYESVTSGGRVSALRIGHAWVLAHIDWEPSRGAVQREGDTWVALDASTKRYTLKEGFDWRQLSVNAVGLGTAIADGATYDEDTLSSLDETALVAARTRYVDDAQAALEQAGLADARLDALLPSARIAPSGRSLLPTGRPYNESSATPATATLADTERHTLTLRLRPAPGTPTTAAPLVIERPLSAFAGRALGVRFVSADEEVTRALADALGTGPFAAQEDVPSAIDIAGITLEAEVVLGNVVLGRTGPFDLGQALTLALDHQSPTRGTRTHRLAILAGESHRIGWNLHGGTTLASTTAALATAAASGSGADASTAVTALLDAGVAGYFGLADQYHQWQAAMADGRTWRMPGVVSVHTRLEVERFLGLPERVHATGIGLDVATSPLIVAVRDGDGPRRSALARQSHALSSALGHAVLERLYGAQGALSASGSTSGPANPPESAPAASTLRAFREALAAGDTGGDALLRFEQEGAAGRVDQGEWPGALRVAARAALARGEAVTVTAAPVTIGPWRGHGWNTHDPLTGASCHRLLGGTREVTDARDEREHSAFVAAPGAALLVWAGFAPSLDTAALATLLESAVAGGTARLAGIGRALDAAGTRPLGDDLAALLASTRIDLALGGSTPAVIAGQLWPALHAPALDLARLEDPLPPAITLSVLPETVKLGESATVIALAQDDTVLDGANGLVVTVDGTPLALDATGRATVTPTRAGTLGLRAVATDTSGNRAERVARLRVTDPGDTTPPVVSFSAPGDGAEVTAPVDVVATISDDSPVNWRLLWRSTSDAYHTELARGAGPVGTPAGEGAPLHRLDPTLALNGLYRLVLEATDANGQVTTAAQTVRLDGEMKVGHFSFTVLDLEVPLSGIPIRVTRTYDTRRKAQVGDFGHGWTVGYQDVKVEESRTPGTGWALTQTTSGPLGSVVTWCVRAGGGSGEGNEVAVTLPDGRVETFAVKASPECQQYVPAIDVNIEYEASEGTHSTLEWVGATQLRLTNDVLTDIGAGTGEPFDPQRYRLTTKEGFVYELDQSFGIRTITDRNGNVISYSDDGITHSDGRSVGFGRDGEGRITSVTDPAGNALRYGYDARGDLVRATDRMLASTTYRYDATHAMTAMEDALGRTPLRNLYDDEGRLTAQLDADGHRTEFAHDIDARQSVVTDRLGRVTQLFHDDDGNVIRRVNALGEATTMTYDARGNALTTTNALGHTELATYDAQDNVLTQTDGEGNTVSFSYNALGQELTLTDARGNTFENRYDAFGNVLAIIDPLGHVTGQNIDAKGRVSLQRDALGNTTSFTYDDAGNKLTETDALGHVTRWTYDDSGNVLSETRTRTVDGIPTPETTRFTYDATGNLLSTTDALGHVTRTEYDALGNETAHIGARGNRTGYSYDAYRRLTKTTYPDGSTETNAYDAQGNLQSATDRLGRVTAYTYDALDRQVAITHPDGATERTEYDAGGRVLAEVDARGYRTTFAYDKANRRTAITDALGYVTTYSYDKDDNLVATADARGHTTRFEHDALDRRVATIAPGGERSEDEYDATGRHTASIDENGRRTRYTYYPLGRLSGVTDALGRTTTYAYDEVGNRAAQTDASGRTTTWTYDALGRVLTRTMPLDQTETHEYDANGNRVASTDFNGTRIEYDSDTLDRLTTKRYADGRQTVTEYDAAGNGTSVIDTRGKTTFTFDNRYRLIEKAEPDGIAITYAYDENGKRTQRTLTMPGQPDTTQIYEYDALNRLVAVIANDGERFEHDYDQTGNRTTDRYPNGTTTTRKYDTNGRLIELEISDSTGTPMQRFINALDATGRRTAVEELDGRTIAFTYDASYRLIGETVTEADGSTTTSTYAYDATGNRTHSTEDGVSTAYTYDDNDRLLKQGGISYAYDDAGNQTEQRYKNELTRQMFDDDHRLVRVEQLVGGDLIEATDFTYDADQHRIGINDGTSPTRHVIDATDGLGQVVAEVDVDGLLVTVVHGFEPYRRTDALEQIYLHADSLGSTRALSDDAGAALAEYDFDAWGKRLDEDIESAPPLLHFAGGRWDKGTGQYYLRARSYAPSQGRFTQVDPFLGMRDRPITLHKYAYANLDPQNFTDPTGEYSVGQFLSAASTAATLASVGATSFELTSLFIGGGDDVSARDIGAAILLGLIGQKILKPLARLCKARESRTNRCKVAFATAEAERKMRNLVSRTPNARFDAKLSKQFTARVVSPVIDKKRGRGVAAFNGPIHSVLRSRQLRAHARKFGMRLGQERACGTPFTVGRCAEWRAANLLLKSGSKIKSLIWLPARNVQKGANGYLELGTVRGPCGICDRAGFGP